jgi:MscS family membrane protein
MRNSRILLFGLVASWAFLLAPLLAQGQDSVHPLKPPDRSSPRATLKTFLDSGDALGAFLAHDYFPSPSREKYQHLLLLNETAVQCLDLSKVAPAARGKIGRAAVRDLYETLSRIELPPPGEIPGASKPGAAADANSTRWVIPNTEIALVRLQSGPQTGQFVFSQDTVSRADEFFARVRVSAYTRAVPLENIRDILAGSGGWMVPYEWIRAMPSWLKTPLAGQSCWKWVSLAMTLCFFLLLLRSMYNLSHRSNLRNPFLQALVQMTLPVYLLVAAPAVAYLALVQINFTDDVASGIGLAATAVMYIAGAWILWRIAPVIAEAIIASPHVGPESINAHLIRICSRLLGCVAVAVFLANGATRLGVPVYGVVGGLGVGGLAIALAAQSTVENLIGGLSLFADKPIRVGDLCQYGTDIGTIEAIGIRSTRIRGMDRTLTTIPNASLSKMPVVNFTERDRMLVKAVVSVRYETSPEQMRYLLVKIREMLLSHPRIHHDPARARFIGFGASSLDIEVFAYVKTRDWAEFLAVREDVFLRVMTIVHESGTSFAFPSRTLYFGRDGGLDAESARAAETQVQQWRDEGSLPLPNFSPDQMRKIRGSLVYPPVGSTEASDDKPGDKNPK